MSRSVFYDCFATSDTLEEAESKGERRGRCPPYTQRTQPRKKMKISCYIQVPLKNEKNAGGEDLLPEYLHVFPEIDSWWSFCQADLDAEAVTKGAAMR